MKTPKEYLRSEGIPDKFSYQKITHHMGGFTTESMLVRLPELLDDFSNQQNQGLSDQKAELVEACKPLINLAEYGIEPCVKNSRPEERSVHEDGLRAIIERANQAIKNAE